MERGVLVVECLLRAPRVEELAFAHLTHKKGTFTSPG